MDLEFSNMYKPLYKLYMSCFQIITFNCFHMKYVTNSSDVFISFKFRFKYNFVKLFHSFVFINVIVSIYFLMAVPVIPITYAYRRTLKVTLNGMS